MTPKEVERLNSGEDGMVFHISHPTCDLFTPECHIYLYGPPDVTCGVTNYPFRYVNSRYFLIYSDLRRASPLVHLQQIRYYDIVYYYGQGHIKPMNLHAWCRIKPYDGVTFPDDVDRKFKVTSTFCKFYLF